MDAAAWTSEEYSTNLKGLVLKCIDAKPHHRPSARDITILAGASAGGQWRGYESGEWSGRDCTQSSEKEWAQSRGIGARRLGCSRGGAPKRLW